jgi:hypothetical protein
MGNSNSGHPGKKTEISKAKDIENPKTLERWKLMMPWQD